MLDSQYFDEKRSQVFNSYSEFSSVDTVTAAGISAENTTSGLGSERRCAIFKGPFQLKIE